MLVTLALILWSSLTSSDDWADGVVGWKVSALRGGCTDGQWLLVVVHLADLLSNVDENSNTTD